MNKKSLFCTLPMALYLCSCSQSGEIRLNQVGYYPDQEKVAVMDGGKVGSFTVTDAATGAEVLSGKASYTAVNSWSPKERTVLDFSSLTTPGTYMLNAGGRSVQFEVKENALTALADAALKSFYLQRTGMPIEEQYAGKWNRPAGHPDTCVWIHPSAAGPVRRVGEVISSPKGWYDAGDYNKYIVNSGYSIGLMQAIYSLFPDYFAKQNLNIPESDNSTPDLLDEMYYNLSWMLTMQDPADGGVYHKLTTPSFEGFVKPVDCRQPRYVVQKSVTAALDFAASMAQASTLFAAYEKDYPGFSRQALAAAKRAYNWALKHPEAYYRQSQMNNEYDPDVYTGEYGDNNASDEFFWAATELYYATGNKTYRDKAIECAPDAYTAPSWGSTSALGFYQWLLPNRRLDDQSAAFAQQLKEKLLSYADEAIKGADASAFHAPYGDEESDFFWGCLSERCANQATSLVYAYMVSGNREYLINAYRNMDYLLGRNATGYCYVTGFGSKSPMHPHHRLSASDDIVEPLPGFLVGGPNPGQQDGAELYTSSEPDESYADNEASYASNEIAINWSAGLVALSSALDALESR